MRHVQPLSSAIIERFLRNHGIRARFVRYEDLRSVQSIDQILPCFLIYQHGIIGHFVCLLRVGTIINYFDPLGLVPDWLVTDGNYTHYRSRASTGMNYTYIARLLADEPEINYNDIRLQSDDSMACGYWVCLRLLFGSLDNDQFVAPFIHLARGGNYRLLDRVVEMLFRKFI